jgi:glycine/D-amino acid oxidase-like deaminating enzyme
MTRTDPGLFTEDASPLGQPYWWDGIDWPRLDAPPPETVDLLVIGAGYTGLSAAIAAHDAGARVAVIDAGQPGQGASTRNGGMVGAHPRLGWDALAKSYGDGVADAIFAEAAPSLAWVKALIETEGIDCDYQNTGRIQLAYTPAHLARQRRLVETVSAKSPVRCDLVERDALSNEIATPLYEGGLVFPEHGAVHPAKYHHGLLAAVLRRGISVAADCPAIGHARDGKTHGVTTPKGKIRADRIVLATNGYTRAPFGWFARRVFPLPSFLIATEPLSSNLIGKLAPGRRMMVETRARHSYFRVSPDGSRILFGGRAAMVNVDLSTAAKRLRRTMGEIWPELQDVRLSHVWTGNTGYSFGHMPQVGEEGGVHYAMGFSGSGTVMAPYLGAKAAWMALGDPRGETAYAKTRLRPRWFHPTSTPYFLRPADWWYRGWVDRTETSSARK